jgi:hypothetical protein
MPADGLEPPDSSHTLWGGSQLVETSLLRLGLYHIAWSGGQNMIRD